MGKKPRVRVPPRIVVKRAERPIWEKRWKKKPSRRLAIQAWESMRDEDPSTWTPVVVLGCFFWHYHDWCRAQYVNESITHMYLRVEEMVEEEGAERVVQGIRALFLHLDWVTRKDFKFLSNYRTWSRFVAPAIVTMNKTKGEQSEHSGRRHGGLEVKRRK